MLFTLRGLPILVEPGEQSQPAAFWWLRRRYVIQEYIGYWDDNRSSTAHWLVKTDDWQQVSLIYDRAESQWLVERIDTWPNPQPDR